MALPPGKGWPSPDAISSPPTCHALTAASSRSPCQGRTMERPGAEHRWRVGSWRESRESPPGDPGLWPGAVGRCCTDRRLQARGMPGFQESPITGAGLDPSCTPAGIPSNGSDGEGCWGRETAGADADVGVVVVRVVAVPVGGAAVVGIVDPGAAAQQLNDPPSTSTYAPGRQGGVERNETSFEAPTAPSRAQQPQSNSQGQKTAQGLRAEGSRAKKGAWGRGTAGRRRRRRCRRCPGGRCPGRRRGSRGDRRSRSRRAAA